MSRLTAQKIQGKTQWKIGIKQQGVWSYVIYSHTLYRLENGESATIIDSYLLKRRLTAPILLPQPTTLCPISFKYLAA